MSDLVLPEELASGGPGDPESGDALLAGSHYYWGCCMVCRAPGTGPGGPAHHQPLKRCSRCNCMFYCSAEHQRQHWKQHKALCKYLSSAAQEVDADNFFSVFTDPYHRDDSDGNGEEGGENERDVAWRKFRVNAVMTCAVLMGRDRPLEEWEKEMFLFPRACRVCHRANKFDMWDCPTCMCVTYCSQQHRDEDRESHAANCLELKFAMACDSYESSISVASPTIPADVDDTYVSLLPPASSPSSPGTTMRDVMCDLVGVSRRKPVVDAALELEQRFLSNGLTAPLSILHAAERHGLCRGEQVQLKEKLTVHVAGANVVEMLGLIKWEFLIHRLPRCQELHYVFIGPELPCEEKEGVSEQFMPCTDCSDRGRRVLYEVRRREYKDYAKSHDYLRPDMVVAFNSGFHEYAEGDDAEKDTWSASLPFLVQHADVPLLFTSYTRAEAAKDLELLRARTPDLRLKVDAEGRPNPFRSHRPIRDFEVSDNKDVFYNNQFYSVVRSRHEHEDSD